MQLWAIARRSSLGKFFIASETLAPQLEKHFVERAGL
jgi:hypothetical protein